MLFPVITQGLVERSILFFCDFFRFTHPNRFGLVQLLEFVGNFLYFLFLFFSSFFLNFFDFWPFVLTLFRFLFSFFGLVFLFLVLFFVFTLSDFLLSSLFNLQINVEANEL